jgi:MFS family permease
LLLLLQSIISTQAGYEFNPSYSRALTIAVYMGMLFGALFWGLSADVIGRRFAFNVSLFICSIFATVAGAAPNWASLAAFIALLGFGGGGNLIMDTTVFIEYLPSNKQWVLSKSNSTLFDVYLENFSKLGIAWLAAWWGLGQAIAGFIAWGFLGEWSPSSPTSHGADHLQSRTNGTAQILSTTMECEHQFALMVRTWDGGT